MIWDIDFERIGVGDDTKMREKLTARGQAGWEPYAIVGITHYFKRCVNTSTNNLPIHDGDKILPPPKKKK